jgi:hypothetical protein
MLRFGVKHLLALTWFTAIILAMPQFPRAFAQAAIVIQVSIAFHLFVAKRLQCYESIFAGAVATFITALLIPHASGSWTFGCYWFGMLEPLSMIRWLCMLGVGGIVQVQYTHAHRRHELWFERE